MRQTHRQRDSAPKDATALVLTTALVPCCCPVRCPVDMFSHLASPVHSSIRPFVHPLSHPVFPTPLQHSTCACDMSSLSTVKQVCHNRIRRQWRHLLTYSVPRVPHRRCIHYCRPRYFLSTSLFSGGHKSSKAAFLLHSRHFVDKHKCNNSGGASAYPAIARCLAVMLDASTHL